MKWVAGTKHSPTNDNRATYSQQSTYTVFQSGTTYYGESNHPDYDDQSSTDCTTLLQSVIDQLATDDWGSIHLKAGVYEVTGLDLSGVYGLTLTGEGRGRPLDYAGGAWKVEGTVLQLADAADDHLLKMDEAASSKLTGLTLRDLTLYGNASNQTAAATSDCIFLDHVKETVIENCTIQRARRYAISYNGACENNWLLNNDIRQDGNGYDAIYVETSLSTKIEGNLIQGATAAGKRGIYFVNSSHYNLVKGNWITDNALGIRVETSDYNRIIDNWIADNDTHGIQIYNDSHYNHIEHNDIRSNDANDGINITDGGTGCTYTHILHNDFTANARYGVYLLGNTAYTLLRGNTWSGNVSGNLVDSGTSTDLPSVIAPFVDGSVADDRGWDIDQAAEYARAYLQVPSSAIETIRMRIWAHSVATETHAMELAIAVNGGADNAAYNTHTYTGAGVDSTSTNFAADDVIHWTVTDAAVLALSGGDSVEVKVVYAAADGDNCATDARFRCVELQYI